MRYSHRTMNTAGGCNCAPSTMCWPQQNPTVPGPDCHYHTGEVVAMKTADLETKGASIFPLVTKSAIFMATPSSVWQWQPYTTLNGTWNSGVLLWYMLLRKFLHVHISGKSLAMSNAMKLRIKTKVNLVVADCTVALPDPYGNRTLGCNQ